MRFVKSYRMAVDPRPRLFALIGPVVNNGDWVVFKGMASAPGVPDEENRLRLKLPESETVVESQTLI